MSPERRRRAIEALANIEDIFRAIRKDRNLEDLSDADLTIALLNIESWIDSATATDAGRKF